MKSIKYILYHFSIKKCITISTVFHFSVIMENFLRQSSNKNSEKEHARKISGTCLNSGSMTEGLHAVVGVGGVAPLQSITPLWIQHFGETFTVHLLFLFFCAKK